MSIDNHMLFTAAAAPVLTSSRLSKNLSHVPCKFFRQGACQAGNSCPFSHSLSPSSSASPCKYFQKGNCKFGTKCALAHVLPNGTRLNTKAVDQQYVSMVPSHTRANSGKFNYPRVAQTVSFNKPYNVQPTPTPRVSSLGTYNASQSVYTGPVLVGNVPHIARNDSAIVDDEDTAHREGISEDETDEELKFEEDYVPSSLMDLLSSQELKRKIAKANEEVLNDNNQSDANKTNNQLESNKIDNQSESNISHPGYQNNSYNQSSDYNPLTFQSSPKQLQQVLHHHSTSLPTDIQHDFAANSSNMSSFSLFGDPFNTNNGLPLGTFTNTPASTAPTTSITTPNKNSNSVGTGQLSWLINNNTAAGKPVNGAVQGNPQSTDSSPVLQNANTRGYFAATAPETNNSYFLTSNNNANGASRYLRNSFGSSTSSSSFSNGALQSHMLSTQNSPVNNSKLLFNPNPAPAQTLPRRSESFKDSRFNGLFNNNSNINNNGFVVNNNPSFIANSSYGSPYDLFNVDENSNSNEGEEQRLINGISSMDFR